MWFIAGAFQPPTSQHQCGVFANDCDLQIRKRQRAHFLARVVTPLILVEDLLPAASDAVTTYEFSVGRTVVTVHVAIDVPAVPGRGLGVEHRANGGFHRYFVSS